MCAFPIFRISVFICCRTIYVYNIQYLGRETESDVLQLTFSFISLWQMQFDSHLALGATIHAAWVS